MLPARIILFDVNETLLDLKPLKTAINNLLENKHGFQHWFGQLLQYSLVENCTNSYHDFVAIAGASLDMTATINGKKITETEKISTLQFIKKLMPHADVIPGLTMLKQNGFRLAPLQTSLAQLAFAKIDQYFEEILSVDVVKKYKPSPEPYFYASETLKVSADEIMFVAAHGWDIAGAANAGMQTAFINRASQSIYPLAKQPTHYENNILLLAKKLIQ